MRGHSLAIANHSTSHLAWHLTGWSPRQVNFYFLGSIGSDRARLHLTLQTPSKLRSKDITLPKATFRWLGSSQFKSSAALRLEPATISAPVSEATSASPRLRGVSNYT